MRCATLLITIALIATVLSQGNPPPTHAACEIPSEWSGFLSQVLSLGELGAEYNIGQVYYSQHLERVRVDIIDGATNIGGTVNSYSVSVWQDFTNEIEYVLDRDDNTCTSIPLIRKFGTGQLPENVYFGGSVMAGGQAVHEYFFTSTVDSHTFQIEVGLTTGACLPFNVDVFNATATGQPQNMVIVEAFLNQIPMVPPFVLDIPSMCTQSNSNILTRPKVIKARESVHMHSMAMGY